MSKDTTTNGKEMMEKVKEIIERETPDDSYIATGKTYPDDSELREVALFCTQQQKKIEILKKALDDINNILLQTSQDYTNE